MLLSPSSLLPRFAPPPASPTFKLAPDSLSEAGFPSTFGANLLCFSLMKRVFLILLTATLPAPQNMPIAAGAIEGSVINASTMLPLAGAPITVAGGAAQFGAVSDESGHFMLPSIAPGSYTVSAMMEDFSGPEVNASSPAEVASNLYVIAGQTSRITLALVPSALIRGTVFDDRRAPAIGATIQLMRLIYSNGVPKLSDVGSQTADDQGSYRFTRLRPGQYYALAAPKAAADKGTPGEAVLTRTFFPGALDITQSAVISLFSGSEVTGVNITLQRGDLFRVSGQVTNLLPDLDPKVTLTSTISLLPHGAGLNAPSSIRSVSVSMGNPANGQFEIANVPSGVYDLYASLPDARGGGTAYGKTTVSVSGGDQGGINIQVHRGVNVEGRVMVDGGLSPSFNNVRITLQPEDNAAALAGYQQVSRFQPRIDSDGNFTIPAVPEGQFRIQVSFVAAPQTQPRAAPRPVDPFAPSTALPPALVTVPLAGAPLGSNGYVADILQGGRTVYNSGISVGTQSFEPLELHIRTDGGDVDGVVLDGTLRPVPGATVVLAPLVQYRQNPALFRVATSDEAGRYTMTGIRPGEYKILAWADIQPGAYLNTTILNDYRNNEMPVTVPGNIRVETKVTAIPRN